MEIKLPYGKNKNISVNIPDNNILSVLEPVQSNSSTDISSDVQKVLAEKDFSGFLKREGSLLVIVNDGTRPTPTAEVLDVIADDLEAAEAEFIIAAGAHRASDDTELRFIFGRNFEKFRNRILIHDARNGEMFYAGTTSRGTEVYYNKKVETAEKILIIGSVEPHYFAGFTGGRKGLLPGVSTYSTIEQNHKLALKPEAASLKLNGNPVHEDMVEACRLVRNDIFTIMTVLDREQQISSVTAGGLEPAFEEACGKAERIFRVPFPAKADLVIACAKYPMDIDLYQSQKALENAKTAVRDGGILLLVSSCRDGIGDDTFYRLISSGGTPEEILAGLEQNYRLGFHKAGKLVELCGRVQVKAFTGLDDVLLKNIFIEPVSDVQQIIDKISETGGSVIVMPDASVTVPCNDNI